MSQPAPNIHDTVSPRVMLVDDDPDIVRTSRAALESAGYEVWSAGSAEAAMKTFVERGVPHLAIIDIHMPGVDGMALSRQIKSCCDLPIVMMTSEADANAVVTALDEFAEDYITKPVDLAVLVARVGRVLRSIRDFGYTVNALTPIDDRLGIEFTKCRAIVEGREIPLTPTETKLLHILLRDAGRTVRTEFLLQRLWPLEEVFEDTLRVHVCRLRRKIEEDPKNPQYVLTVRGQGYRLPGMTSSGSLRDESPQFHNPWSSNPKPASSG